MSKLGGTPEIQQLCLEEIIADEKNPRTISSEAMAGLTASLERFGLVDLLVVNKRTMKIVSGHQRFRVLREKNVRETTCLMVDLSDEDHRILSITMNNPKIMGEFTAEVIGMLEDIRRNNYDAYISLTMESLREDLSNLEIEKEGNTLEDDIPSEGIKNITEPGDTWILGEHRLMCGNSCNPEHVKSLMMGRKASLFSTDPPYCVDYTGADRPGGGHDWSNVYHEIDIPDARAFMRDFLSLGLEHVKDNTAIYMWHASKRHSEITDVCRELGILIHQQIIWVKPCTILTYSFYSWRHEPCFLMWKKGQRPGYKPKNKSIGSVWPVGLRRSGDPASPEYYSDIWELDWEGKKRNPGLAHPTVKPVEIFAIPMRVHTRPGDICYEPFSGSGSQIIAAEKLNRRCFAMELEMHFCDVAVKRWEEYTGKKAELIRR